MPVSSPSFSSRALFAIALGGSILSLVVLITGGFVIDAGVLHLSVRNWVRPLLVATATSLLALHAGRAELLLLAQQVAAFLDRHASALVTVLAAAAAADGVAFGGYAAAGSDQAGYVSQAHLFASGQLTIDEPLIRQVDWAGAPHWFSPLAYRPGLTPGELVPTYPPGLPLVMALALRTLGSYAEFLVSPFLGALAVWCTFALGRRLHSATAGLCAAALLATSPIFLFQIPQAMSDVPVTAWWTLALLLGARRATFSSFLSGVATGLAVLTRPNLAPLSIAVGVTMLSPRPGQRQAEAPPGRLVLAYIAGGVPAAIGLALLQNRLYGSPLRSGYGAISDYFGTQHIIPNVEGFAARLLEGEAAVLGLAAIALVVLAITRRRNRDVSSLSTASIPAIAASTVISFCYVSYVAFEDWAYLRFLMPAFPPVFVAVGAMLATACSRLPSAVRGMSLLIGLAVVGSLNVNEARRQAAFLIRRNDARYHLAGRYLGAMLHPQAVVIASQQSASAKHYTGRPVVRWDLIPFELDAAIESLRALGRRPVLVVEVWEEPEVRARFRESASAQLDWPPVADIGDYVRVRVYDPAERRAAKPPKTDRLH
jgi:hypothetical protein